MTPHPSIIWPGDVRKARELQALLAGKIRLVPLEKAPSLVAGVDAAFIDDRIVAVACLFRYPEMDAVEDVYAIRKADFPYIPGLLSFREGPAVMEAIGRLRERPDLILFDGQGIAHPRGLGIACHVGVLLDVPSIGCAKSRLVGSYVEPGRKRGSSTGLMHNGQLIGRVVRTKDNVRPLFVSPGHRVDVDDAVRVVLECSRGYRLPEPVRRADALSKKIKKKFA